MVYKVRKKDIKQASNVMADAFKYDPLWNKICEGESDLQGRFRALFEIPIRHCLKYGEVYATSENLEGVVAWVPGKYADMSTWRIITSGAMPAAMRMGSKPARKMAQVFIPVTKDRDDQMAGISYIYLLLLGVATQYQGKGFGKKLILEAIEKSTREEAQIYLETETEENVKMYEHFGFKLLKRITLPAVELPMWEMARKPEA